MRWHFISWKTLEYFVPLHNLFGKRVDGYFKVNNKYILEEQRSGWFLGEDGNANLRVQPSVMVLLNVLVGSKVRGVYYFNPFLHWKIYHHNLQCYFFNNAYFFELVHLRPVILPCLGEMYCLLFHGQKIFFNLSTVFLFPSMISMYVTYMNFNKTFSFLYICGSFYSLPLHFLDRLVNSSFPSSMPYLVFTFAYFGHLHNL